GPQGGSGQTPLPLELRSAVAGPAGSRFRVDLREICVRKGRKHLRTEVPHDRPGSVVWALTVRRLAVGTRPQMGRYFGAAAASVKAPSYGPASLRTFQVVSIVKTASGNFC